MPVTLPFEYSDAGETWVPGDLVVGEATAVPLASASANDILANLNDILATNDPTYGEAMADASIVKTASDLTIDGGPITVDLSKTVESEADGVKTSELRTSTVTLNVAWSNTEGWLVTVADAGKVKLYMKNFGEFYNNQIEHASAIILSRTQNLSEEKLAAAVALLREKNAQAPIVTTPWDELSGAQLLDAMERRGTLMAQLAEEVAHEHAHEHHHEEGCTCEACRHGHEEEHAHGHGHEHEHHEHGDACGCGHHHGHEGHHHADEVFQSFGGETPRVYTEAELNDAFTALDSGEYGAVLRAKGIVAGPQGWLHFDYVPGEGNVRAGAPDYTGRICVIGTGLPEQALRELFHL